jgi:hypothetical protein
LSLGQLPAADALTERQAERFAEFLGHLPDAPTGVEAAALVGLLPPDETTAFGLAWTVVHSIESSPEWPRWEVLVPPKERTSREAVRCLKRYLARHLYRQLQQEPLMT